MGSSAAAFARRAHRVAAKQLHPKASKGLRAKALAPAARVYARGGRLFFSGTSIPAVRSRARKSRGV